MNSEFFPAIVFALVGMVVVAVIATVLRRKAQRRLETLGPAFELGTARRAAPLSNGVIGVYRGYNCRYLIQHQSQYDRGGAVLRLGLYSPQRWSAEQLNAGSRMLIRVGLAKDFDVGDHELDEHFRFSTDSESDLQSVFSIEKVRETMHLLVAIENFQSISVRADRMDITWSPRNPKLDDDPEELRARLEVATDFAASCGYFPKLDL